MLLAIAPAWSAAAALQAGAADQRRYQECLALADRAPEEAAEAARAWAAEPGAEAVLATHCLAVALVGAGSYAQAATALQGLVGAADEAASASDDGLILELRIQTGHAWMLAQQPDLAEAMFDAALRADPDEATRWVDRARARADRENWPGALSDLDQALRLDPEGSRIYALRASAWRRTGNPVRALEDIEVALALAPRLPEALLERGLLRRDRGDLAGAREDWLQLRLSAPGSEAGQVAGTLLEELDLKQTE